MSESGAYEDLRSGAAWEAFCDGLKEAGRDLMRETAPKSPVDVAEGHRFLTRMLRSAWTGKPFDWRGREVLVTPPPATPGGPKIFVGGKSVPGARRAAPDRVPAAAYSPTTIRGVPPRTS